MISGGFGGGNTTTGLRFETRVDLGGAEFKRKSRYSQHHIGTRQRRGLEDQKE